MYPQFRETLISLGQSNVKRGEALEVSSKTIERYLDDDLPEPLLKLMRRPELLRALADDAEAILEKRQPVAFAS